MKSSIYQSQVINLKALNNLFIELTGKYCNLHCKHCYIDFPQYKKVDDFISIDFKHVGPSFADNYLIIFDVISRKYMAQTFKSWIKMIALYGVIAAIVLFIML